MPGNWPASPVACWALAWPAAGSARRALSSPSGGLRTASTISATNLGERIDPEQVDAELVELANVLNDMFQRLQLEFERQTRFTADASHELRTPLTIIRTHAELALARSRSPEEYRAGAHACLRGPSHGYPGRQPADPGADVGKLELEKQPVNLTATIADCVELMRPLADARNVAFEAELAAVKVLGDAGRLAQVVTNLLNNAVHYSLPGGNVVVRLTAAGSVAYTVTDHGAGIPELDRPQIFERFFRARQGPHT